MSYRTGEIEEGEEEVKLEMNEKIKEHDEGDEKEMNDLERLQMKLEVEEAIWKYMEQTKEYSIRLEKIKIESDLETVRILFPRKELYVKGKSRSDVENGKKEMEELIMECRNTIKMVEVPLEDDVVVSTVIAYLDGIDVLDGCVVTLEGTGKSSILHLTGRETEVEHFLGLLQETFGVTRPEVAESRKGEVEESRRMGGNTEEELRGNESETSDGKEKDDGDELYRTDLIEMVADDALIVDENLWSYIEKSVEFRDDLEAVKLKSELSIMQEEASSDVDGTKMAAKVRLVFTDSDETKVRLCIFETKRLVERCQAAGVKTICVACQDGNVYNRISRILKSINRLPSYVSLETETILVTGKELEIKNCVDRLKSYGLIYDEEKEEEEEEEEEEENHLHENVSAAGVDRVQRITPPPEPVESRVPMPCHNRELPVPIEELLWTFIDRRRQEELRELRQVYNVEIFTKPSEIADHLVLIVASETLELLDCGQDALVGLIQHLRDTIIMGTIEAEANANLPLELQGLLQQQLQSMQTIVIIKGNKINIIGPNSEAMNSQQVVASFIQNMVLQAQQGAAAGEYNSPTMHSGQMPGVQNVMPDRNPSGFGVGYKDNQSEQRTSLQDATEPFESHDHFSREHHPELFGIDGNVRVKEDEQEEGRGRWRSGAGAGKSDDGKMNVKEMEERRKKGVDETEEDERRYVGFSGSHVKQEYEESDEEEYVKQKKEKEKDRREEEVELEAEEIGGCSICHYKTVKEESQYDKSSLLCCSHRYCLSCVQMYFGEHECPLCAFNPSSTGAPVTQPPDGRMSITYDNSYKLPGFEKNSRGTIVVIYSFPPGIQQADFPDPTRPYPSLTATAFVPLCLDGSKVVDLLQKAFDRRLVFRINENKKDENFGHLTWNGILHKVNVFGGPQQKGYPDPAYLPRVVKELTGLLQH